MEISSVKYIRIYICIYCIKKGTFGQTIPWNLYDPATYQHPSVPLDVLTDPRSLPQNQQKREQEEKDKPSTSVRFKFSRYFNMDFNHLGASKCCIQTSCSR
jgi:hypothetical protein